MLFQESQHPDMGKSTCVSSAQGETNALLLGLGSLRFLNRRDDQENRCLEKASRVAGCLAHRGLVSPP